MRAVAGDNVNVRTSHNQTVRQPGEAGRSAAAERRASSCDRDAGRFDWSRVVLVLFLSQAVLLT